MKIQLDSKATIKALEKELNSDMDTFILEKDHPILRDVLKEVFNNALDVVKQNIQINGHNWNDEDEEKPAIDPIDEELRSKLTQVQVEVNEVLTRACTFRREIPPFAAEVTSEEMAAMAAELGRPTALPGVSVEGEVAEILGQGKDSELLNSYLENLTKQLQQSTEELADLSKSLPSTVNKAIEVLDVAKQRKHLRSEKRKTASHPYSRPLSDQNSDI